MEEFELVKKIQNDDRDAFNDLVIAYQQKVFHIAYSMLFDYEDASDASQEVFVKIYRYINSFRFDSSLSTWIYRITKNVCYDFLRKKKVATVSLDNDSDDSPKPEITDNSNSPETIADAHDLQALVQSALKELDENSRFVITLYDIEGLSYDEISRILKLPLGTVKSRLNRAREKLKKILLPKRELFL